MTIRQAIDEAKRLTPGEYPDSQMVEWLDRLDKTLYNEVVLTHEGAKDVPPPHYDSETDIDETELLAGAPDEGLYGYWLAACIDLYNAELAKYQNSSALYNAALRAFCNRYNRTHKPLQTKQNYL